MNLKQEKDARQILQKAENCHLSSTLGNKETNFDLMDWQNVTAGFFFFIFFKPRNIKFVKVLYKQRKVRNESRNSSKSMN